MKLYVEKRKSKKNDKEYLALIAEKESGKPVIITFDAMAIYKLCGKKKADFSLGEKFFLMTR